MAIAFNLPSDSPAPEESYSRLNRLLAELYDVLCHILVTRQAAPAGAAGAAGPVAREPARDLPRGECPRTDSPPTRAPPYHLRCNSTYIVNLVMVVAILKVSLASSMFNTIR